MPLYMQLNALWGLMVSGGRGWEGGREGAGGMGKGAGKKGRRRGGNTVGMTRYASNIHRLHVSMTLELGYVMSQYIACVFSLPLECGL